MPFSRKTFNALIASASVSAIAARSRAVEAQSFDLNVATTPIDLGGQPFYALDQGFFKKQGLNVNVRTMDNGAEIAAAVAGGSLQIAQGNIVSIATAHDRGLPFVAIASAGIYSASAPTTQMIVLKTSPIRTAKDLAGKVIGISGVKNITEIAARKWIDDNGADASASKYIELRFPEMDPALAAGRVDATVIAEPDLSAALAGDARVLGNVYDAIAKEFTIGLWFTTREWALANREIVKRYVAAIVETTAWANKNRDVTAKILAKYDKIELKPGTHRSVYTDRLDPAMMQPLIDATAKYRVIKSAFPATELIFRPD
jgi:NitT/TauT family transport system substrate-binding protein